jgi:hypothetical protein
VFEFVRSTKSGDGMVECVRRGTARARVPLSAFANDTSAVAQHLLPAFAKAAAAMIPPEFHSATRVLYQATAGMRLLSPPVQESVYDALYRQLLESPEFPFLIRRQDIATLSGDDEGFFGAVAANYLEGTIRADLTLVWQEDEEDNNNSRVPRPLEIVGALDMGGSSTQIVFLPFSDDEDDATSTEKQQSSPVDCNSGGEEDDSARTCPATSKSNPNNSTAPAMLRTDGFFINSYLSYGVDQFRERLWRRWIAQHQAEVDEQVDDEGRTCDSRLLENPCVFRGYTIEFEGYTFIGTGQATACVERVQEFLADDDPRDDNLARKRGRSLGGVEHPPVRGKFYAMSNYFYTLDSVRKFVSEVHLEHEAARALATSWPTPTLHELHEALPLFCDRSWELVLDQHESAPHAYTLPHILPHRCLEAVYMTTLLRDGFGFDPHGRSITFALDVNDSEVEWTLGMALVLHSQRDHQAAAAERANPSFPDKEESCDSAQVEAWVDNSADVRDDDDNERPLSSSSQQDERQNATDPAVVSDEDLLSTRAILRRVARFIETVSALDYMHTM